MTGPRKLLAAAALTMSMTAACSPAGRAPAARARTYPAPVTAAVGTTAPAPAPIAEPVLMPAVEVIAVTAPVAVTEPVVEAAAPRCDENGRPLAGNVRMTKKTTMDCP